MKKCSYCECENPDTTLTCSECGESLVMEAPAQEYQEQPPAPWKKMAVLGGEIEAERVELALKRLEIPHVLVSYRDSAMDGLYQTAKGWGHIEAAEEHREAILACIKDLRHATLQDEEVEPNADRPEPPRV